MNQSRDATRTDYQKHICQRLCQAELVPFRKVSFAGGVVPKVAECHRNNVERWIKENLDPALGADDTVAAPFVFDDVPSPSP